MSDTMQKDFITTIAEELHIPYSSDPDSICRVVYSIAGKMALASLWDHVQNEETISIQYLKNRIQQVFEAYSYLYPSIIPLLTDNWSFLAKEIFSLYIRTGHIYHSPYKLSPAIPQSCQQKRICLYRGITPGSHLYMSGLGYYMVQSSQDTPIQDTVFDIQTQSFADYLKECLSYSEWESIECSEKAQFLRLEPSFANGYWKDSPDENKISLVRYGEPNRIYAFYRYHDGQYQQKAIPTWRLRDFMAEDSNNCNEYRRIATALLMGYSTLPAIKVSIKPKLAHIHLGYRLPPSEETFFQLYSWPLDYDFSDHSPHAFMRIMSMDVYTVFKAKLIDLGYHFVEE